MKINRLNYFSPIILTFVLIANLSAHSRIAFSRPGTFIRTPSALIDSYDKNFYVGFSNEWVGTKNGITANSIYLRGSGASGYEYGISYAKRAPINKDSSPPNEFSFHFAKEIYKKNNFVINAGIQDIFYEAESDNQVSAYISLINKNIEINDEYNMQSALGFGTGKIRDDSFDYLASQSNALDIFVGFSIDTPFLKDRGGVKILTDYDGNGTNVALEFGVTPKLEVKLGIAHFENLVKFNSFQNETNESIYQNSPSLIFGIEYAVAENKRFIERSIQNSDFCMLKSEPSGGLLELNEECGDRALQYLVFDINKNIQTVNDSMIYLKQQLDLSENLNIELTTEKKILEDSIYVQYLNQKITFSEINLGMRHLSESLTYYYSDDYVSALKEVEKAEKYLPNLAYSYARKGSIYYKLGDIDRATINWNIALQLDPEYIEVRQMLINMKNNLEVIPN